MPSITDFDFGNRKAVLTLITASTIAAIAGRAAFKLYKTTSSSNCLIYNAPRIPNKDEEDDPPPYPSDALPGIRDVDTPYGSIRVNEWGPEDGRKVLFIHGISTPSIACAHMAIQLAKEDGCRVMMFDLFGRGYSDTPDPFEYKQDIRLFTTQIMLVLASSSLAWTGTGNDFTLVGYSLGGGIATTFTSYFPQLVSTLVLIAPAGLMRASRIQLSSRLIYGGFLPALLRDRLVRRRIVGPTSSKKSTKTSQRNRKELRLTASENSKTDDNPEFAPGSTAPLFPGSAASAAESVAWQVQKHPGFLSAFISSIKYAPISNEHERWKLVASRLTAQKKSGADDHVQRQGLREGKVLLMFGKSDGVVVPEETAADATEVLGNENVRIELLDGGHDVPITNAGGCVEKIRYFWQQGHL